MAPKAELKSVGSAQPVRVHKYLVSGQVQESTLIDTTCKFESLAALLDEDPRSLKLETLFSTRSSGWTDPAAFHTACDDKGPTLTLIQCSDGVSYGGYTSISWTSNGGGQADAEAFLFRIANFATSNTQQAAEKFPSNETENDVYGSPTRGPIFGAGHDLMTFSGGGQMLTCTAESYSTPGPLIPSTVSRAATSCHMEVLLVSTGVSDLAEELKAPWLTDCSWSMEVLLHDSVMWSTLVISSVQCAAGPAPL